jgi:hypothetical protein
VKDIGGSFIGLEEALSKAFLPSLFDDAFDDNDPRRKLPTFPVKFAGLAIPNPVISSNPNYKASTLICSHIIAAICGETMFCLLEHKEVIRDVKAVLTTCNNAKHETALNLLSSKLSCDDQRTILRGKELTSLLPFTEHNGIVRIISNNSSLITVGGPGAIVMLLPLIVSGISRWLAGFVISSILGPARTHVVLMIPHIPHILQQESHLRESI